MLGLAELQTHVRDAVLGGDAEALNGVIADDRLGYARRLNVYRNNTTILLREALAANFPIVHALVGEDFFATLARAFVRTHPPHSPCLFEYGDAFAAFTETFPGLERLPYVADIARLDFAQVQALHAANAPALDAAALQDVAPEDYGRLAFRPHPATRVVSSPYPIHAIWALHQPGANPHDGVDENHGGEAVLISRPGHEVHVTALAPGEAPCIQALSAGAALETVFADTHIDAAHVLATVLMSGAFTRYALI